MERSYISAGSSSHTNNQSRMRQSFLRSQNEAYRYACDELTLTPFQAKLIIKAHQVDNIPELLNLFTIDDESNQYRHLFFPDPRGLCLICDDTVARHSYNSPIDASYIQARVNQQMQQESLQSQLSSSNVSGSENRRSMLPPEQRYSLPVMMPPPQELVEPAEPEINCVICTNDCLESEIVHFGDTSHNICNECFTAYLTEQKIVCPHCQVVLDAEIIESLVDSRTFKKYQLFLRNNQIMKNPELRWCPNSKCSKIIMLKDEEKKKKVATCVCGTKVCTKCNREYHPSQSCDQVFKEQVKQWSNALDLQKCKKCKSLVEKVSGCNHMTCGVCRYEWCWLCGATYSPIHFSPLNPFGCPGLQNGDHLSRNWGCFRRTMYRIGLFLLILILLPIVIPLFLVLSGPVLFVMFAKRRSCYYYQSCCSRFLTGIVMVVLGLIFNPIVWIGLIIYFLPQGASFLFEYYRRRREMNQITANAIRERLIDQELNS